MKEFRILNKGRRENNYLTNIIKFKKSKTMRVFWKTFREKSKVPCRNKNQVVKHFDSSHII